MSQEENITKLLLKADDKLRKQYETLVRELIAATGEAPKNVSSDELFSIAKHCPRAAKEKIDRLLNEYCAQMTATIQAGITQAILLSSNTSQMAFSEMTRFDEDDVKSWRKTTAEAFREQRLHNMGGLDLSTSVWNYTQQTKAEFELAMSQSIEDALKNGNSAEQLGRAVRDKLNNPNMMYRRYHLKKLMSDGTKKDVVEWRRRVIGQDGKVRFVKEDLEKVGRGVYRSARQNGLRLAMTEINMAYNYANCKRWSEEPFVLGIRIRLSKNHPLTDICDELQGDYPSDFVFTGWHPRCRCSMSSILMDRNSEEWKKLRAMSDAEYNRYVSPNRVKDYPKVFKNWCKSNKEKLFDAAKRNKLPYFVRENRAQVERFSGMRLGDNYAQQIDYSLSSNLVKIDASVLPKEMMTNEQVKKVLYSFIDNNSTFFPKPIRDIVFSCDKVAGTERLRNGFKFYFSNKEINGFNMMKELKGAFHSIANNKEMTLMQETAMETVWHEFLHCHSKAWKNGRVSSAVPLMETLNEFYARQTYPQFVAKFGGRATHYKEIRKSGIGYYSNSVNFQTLLKHFGIGQGVAAKKIGKMLDDTYYDDFLDVSFERIFRNKLSKEDFSFLCSYINMPHKEFAEFLKLV